MSAMDGHETMYRISTFSGGSNCVEVAFGGDILVRHSARRHEKPLRFSRDEWDAFVKGVKAGEFDPA